ncbi:MAG: STAS domain-containing protein [Calditrichaeota bacterium]|nr:STAS domain-containing protein [Calditrichota bacterium]
MKLKKREIENVLVVEISGEIMGGTETEDFRALIFEAIENEMVNIVIDLKKTKWMNSSGLGMLVSGLTTIRSSGGDLRLANISERVRRPLQITRLESIFLSYDSVEEAIHSYQAK